MSLVGTRPPTVDEWEKYELHHRSRMSTKPGITGMWQVSGRSDITDFEEVVRLDTEYIEHWTMLGVREKSGAELIERLTGRKAVVVLDPTLLLNKEEWAQAIPVKPVLENDYIFCYFLGANSERTSKGCGRTI